VCTCHSRARRILSQRGVPFVERDVAQDETALIELEQLGVFTTPVTVIDGEGVLGFNRARLEALLSAETEHDERR
jgi:glutaredoxin 3